MHADHPPLPSSSGMDPFRIFPFPFRRGSFLPVMVSMFLVLTLPLVLFGGHLTHASETTLAPHPCPGVVALGGVCRPDGVLAFHGLPITDDDLRPEIFDIGDFSYFTALELVRGQLQSLPSADFLARLPNLKTIILDGNPIKDLQPLAEWNTSLLITLSLQDTALSTPDFADLDPDSFLGFPQLYFAGSDLSLGFPTIILTEDLGTLDLSRSGVSELPPSVCALAPALVTLKLEDNHLTELPPTVFQNCTQLRMLSLSGNFLTTIPDEVFLDTTRLLGLDLRRNQLQELPESLFPQPMPSLIQLNLNQNHLSELPPNVFSNTPNLNDLQLAGNQLSHPLAPRADNDTQLFHSVQDTLAGLVLAQNQLSRLGGYLEHLTRLSALDLSNNTFQDLDPEANAFPASLVRLSLEGNQIRELRKGDLDGLTKLYHLNLGRNGMQRIEGGVLDHLCSQGELQTLQLFLNDFRNASETLPRNLFQECRKTLRSLDLGTSNITHLSRGSLGIIANSRLGFLSLGFNPVLLQTDLDDLGWFFGSSSDAPSAEVPIFLPDLKHLVGRILLQGAPEFRNLTVLQRLCWSIPESYPEKVLTFGVRPSPFVYYPLPDCLAPDDIAGMHPFLTEPPECNCHGRASHCDMEKCYCEARAYGDWCQSLFSHSLFPFSLFFWSFIIHFSFFRFRSSSRKLLRILPSLVRC